MSESVIVHYYVRKFKELETMLKIIANSDDRTSFYDILTLAEKKNYLIQAKRKFLLDLYALRNVFAHADREKYIAELYEEVYVEIGKVLDMLKNPPTVGTVFKTSVYTATLESPLDDIARTMVKRIFTHVPIYDKDGKFVGTFSESSLLEWLVKNIKDGEAVFHKSRMRDINRKYLYPKSNIVKFIRSDLDIFCIPPMFENAMHNNVRLGAILITHDGSKDLTPIGIITAWDLPKLENYIK